MNRLVCIVAILCFSISQVIASPTPVDSSANKQESVYNENTPKFQYAPVKEGEEQIPDRKLEDGLTPVNQEYSDELPIMSAEEEAMQGAKVDNRNKRTKSTKQLKQKKPTIEDEILNDPELNKMPEMNMASPEQKHYTQEEYEQAYRDLQVPTFSYHHGIDPDQYYDMKDAAWSPYPLLRLNAPIYFKTMAIPQGYYLLTPRQYKDKWYILFKEAGKVKYILPVFQNSYAEAGYYHTHLKEYDMMKTAKWQVKFLNAWGKYVKKSKRKPAIQTNIELTDLDNNFLLLTLYYGHYKYSIIVRTEKF
ncbi:hypothetical protein IKJ53_07625 [bacterium]|nr:hypothetical protein [bacterium]